MYRTWNDWAPLPLRLILGGAFTAVVSVLLIADMLVAMVLVHWEAGFFYTNQPPGIEVNLLFIAGLLALVLGGAGALSMDRTMWGRATTRPRCVAIRRRGSGRANRALAGIVTHPDPTLACIGGILPSVRAPSAPLSYSSHTMAEDTSSNTASVAIVVLVIIAAIALYFFVIRGGAEEAVPDSPDVELNIGEGDGAGG